MNDIDRIKKEIEYWQTEFVPSGNMGKWARQARIDSLNRILKQLEQDNQSENGEL